MGGAVGDYDNDGWPDIYVTCYGGNVLYHNNGDGTFTDVTAKAGVRDGRFSTGAAFGDYDGDGYLDLMVTNYVDLDIHHPPAFGSSVTCKYMGIDVQCGPRGLKGAGDSLFHNNGDGTFSDVSKKAGVDDPNGYYGLTTLWADFNNTGRPDIYVANDSTAGFLYRNDGKGKFNGYWTGIRHGARRRRTRASGHGRGDRRLSAHGPAFAGGDEFCAGQQSVVPQRREVGFSGCFVPYGDRVAFGAVVKWGVAFVDLDNDGWLDLVTVNGHVYPQVDTLQTGARYREPKLVQYNQGDGTVLRRQRAVRCDDYRAESLAWVGGR